MKKYKLKTKSWFFLFNFLKYKRIKINLSLIYHKKGWSLDSSRFFSLILNLDFSLNVFFSKPFTIMRINLRFANDIIIHHILIFDSEDNLWRNGLQKKS